MKQLREELIADGGDAADAYKALVAMSKDESLPADVRFRACKEVLDRNWGRATTRVEIAPVEPPAVDVDMQRALLDDPEACEIAATLDARLSLPSANHRSEP